MDVDGCKDASVTGNVSCDGLVELSGGIVWV